VGVGATFKVGLVLDFLAIVKGSPLKFRRVGFRFNEAAMSSPASREVGHVRHFLVEGSLNRDIKRLARNRVLPLLPAPRRRIW
jgi:hypothetical protein